MCAYSNLFSNWWFPYWLLQSCLLEITQETLDTFFMCWQQFVKPEWPTAHFLTRSAAFLKYPPHICSCHDLMWFRATPAWADVSDLQRGKSGGRPSSLCSPEFRQPRRNPAQSVCRWRPSLLRGEALTQELPLWSLWLVYYTLGCLLLTFLFSLSAAALWCYYIWHLLSFISFSTLSHLIVFTIHCVFLFLPFGFNCDDTFVDTERETIFFNSQQVSKPESSCDLTSVSNNWDITHTHAL